MAVKKEIEINVNTSKAEKNVDDLNQGLSGVTAQADKLTGGLVSGFKNGIKGIRNAVKGFKSLKVAIASTGIGLLVVALGSLVSFFTKTQRGADKLSQAMAGIGAVVDVLIDRVSNFGEGLFAIIRGDFSEGLNILKGTFAGLGKEIREEAKAAVELEKAEQALEDRQIALIKVNAERRASIEQLRLVAEDENKTNEERAQALRDAAELQNQIADDEIAIAKERARIVKERVALGESTRDDLREQAEAEARVIELEAERARRLRTLQTRLNAFTDAQEELTDSLGNYEEAFTKVASKEIQFAADTAQVELDMHKRLRSDMLMVDQQYASSVDGIRQDSLKKTRSQKMAELDIVAGALGSLANLAGENAQAGKALSAAEAIINTYTGATKALAQGGIFGAISAAGVVASGIASVRQIYATPIPTQTGGGGSTPRPSIQAPQISPRLSLNTQVSDLGNQITQSLQGQPMRAYVVNQDIQNAGKMDRKIEQTATFG